MRHFSKPKNMTRCARATYNNASRARPILDVGASLKLGAWDLEFHKMTHFERKRVRGASFSSDELFRKRSPRFEILNPVF